MKQLRVFLMITALMAISLSVQAKPRTKAEMSFLANKVFSSGVANARGGQTSEELTLVLKKEGLSVYAADCNSQHPTPNTRHPRFAIVSNDDLLPAVLGYSETPFDPELKNLNFRWWLETMNAACKYRIENNIPAVAITPGPEYKSRVDSLCTSQWGQETPYNNMCPKGTSSSWFGASGFGQCITGCVATSMSQVLYYFRSPKYGQGSTHSVQVKQPNGNYKTYTVDYDQAVYDYDSMLDSYAGDYTEEQADAVAMLMYHCGVAADMDYAVDGSGTYHLNACNGLERNFGCVDATYCVRSNFTDEEWMNMIFNEISNGSPLIYGGDDLSKWAGHSFVFDGYDEEGKAHVNWGWNGEDDGYFDVATLSVEGYEFSSDQDMIIGIGGSRSGNFYAIDLDLGEGGTLADYVSELEVPLDSIAYITLSGNVDSTDIATIRKIGMDSVLRKVDLRFAEMADSLLPDSAFAQCTNLRYVTLPKSVSKIGSYAFMDCTALSELRLYNRERPETGTNVFKGVNLSNAALQVRTGMKSHFSGKTPWRSFNTIGEFGITVTASKCTRNIGEPNPEFSWTVKGGTIDGEPEITCDATEDSPAGTYILHTSRGTIENPDVDLIDGIMVVKDPAVEGIDNLHADQGNSQAPAYDIHGRPLNHYPSGTIVITNKRVKVLP